MSLFNKYRQYAEVIDIVHSIYSTAIIPFLSMDHVRVSTAATFLLTACNTAVDNASISCSHVVSITHESIDLNCIFLKMY